MKYLGGEFRSIGRVLTDEDSDVLRTGIREYYDEWQRKMLKSTMKRAGVLVGIGLSIAAVVTGLAVGLTRGGSDVIHAGKKRRKWEKLNPAKVSIPWSDIEEAGGGALIFTGKYLTVILGVVLFSMASKKLLREPLTSAESVKSYVKLAVGITASTLTVKYLQQKKYTPEDPFKNT